MPKTSEQKRKILELCRIFEERTDDEHGMTAAELIGALDECGVSAERKSLYGDIDALRDFGMDIVSVREGQRTEYRLVSRTFELAELKLLVDAVQASRFITPKKQIRGAEPAQAGLFLRQDKDHEREHIPFG